MLPIETSILAEANGLIIRTFDCVLSFVELVFRNGRKISRRRRRSQIFINKFRTIVQVEFIDQTRMEMIEKSDRERERERDMGNCSTEIVISFCK